MLKVVIDRKRWFRGKGGDESMLRNSSTGKMCCIGFLARRLGCSIAEINNVQTLADVENGVAEVFEDRFSGHLGDAYEANDRTVMGSEEREAEIKTIGRLMGVRFSFKN